MTALMVSVRDANEVAAAQAAGADALLVTRPAASSRAKWKEYSAAVQRVADGLPLYALIDASASDLPDDVRCLALFDALPGATALAVVAQAGFAGALIAVAPRGRDGQLALLNDVIALSSFFEGCRAHGLLSAIGGAIEPPDVPRLLRFAPDFLASEMAVHDGSALQVLRDLVPAIVREPRVLAQRVQMPERAYPTDRVFVRDFVVSMAIGAYAFERDLTQKVRFNVEADVRRAAPGDDMRHVFSYDVIVDAIRLATQRGHVAVVETLAHEVADATLQDMRVQCVRVRVEKLDVLDGSVGVEIERSRVATPSNVVRFLPDAPQSKPGSG